MKLPKYLDLLGGRFEIKIVEPEVINAYSKIDEIDMENHAAIVFDKKIIYINKDRLNQKDEIILNSLFHEFGHQFAEYCHIEDSELFAIIYSNYICSLIKQLHLEQNLKVKK
jgi:hypothetical protein